MTHLYYVRHAESLSNTTPEIIAGRSNHSDLTEKGIRQARAFGRWLAQSGIQPNAIYTSPANRTAQTMNYSLDETDIALNPEIDYRIQELAQGVMEGLNRYDVYTPDVVAQIEVQGLDFKFEGGQTMRDAMDQMEEFHQEKVAEHRGGTVIVYSHGLAIRSLVGRIHGLSHRQVLDDVPVMANVSLTHIENNRNGDTVHVVGQNVIDEKSV